MLAAAKAMDRAGLTEGTAGNLSARAATGEIVLTPTAMRYAEMDEDDLVVTDVGGRALAGHRAPTTEIELHLACLRRFPEIGAVVHSHPIHASMFAACDRPIPCVVEEVELYVGGDVPVAAYHATGTPELGAAVAELLHDRAAALLSHHGLVVVARSPGEALELTKLVERTARIAAGAERIGTPKPLPEAAREAFRQAYRARRQRAGS
ncbi:MAG: class II aldolase/adducin family protein [Myxococcota bacterium]